MQHLKYRLFSRDKIHILIVCFVLIGIIFRFASLNSYGFWRDESRQFWTSKGIHPDYFENTIDVQVQNPGFSELIKNTHARFLGSPSFTVFIHYWSKIFNSVPWLRIIPCLFGIATLLLIYLIAVECDFSKKWALAILAFSTYADIWFSYSTCELKPYSFEIFCSALTLLFLIKILKSRGVTIIHCLWLALSVLLGISSGYGYHIYYPFIVAFLIVYIMKADKDSKRRKILKTLIILTPVGISLFYISFYIYDKLISVIAFGFQAPHLTYLKQYLHLGLGTYVLQAVKMISSAVSWQFFGQNKVVSHGFATLILSSSLIIFSALFLLYSIFILILAVKKKNIMESAVLATFIYSIAMCTVLSTKGLATIGPTRHNLFFSPVLFISFFICAKYFYETLKKSPLKIKEGLFLAFLLIFLLMPNMYRHCKALTGQKYREDLRSALRKIQATVKENDNICIYTNWVGVPTLEYERRYSNIPWVSKLKGNDISMDLCYWGDMGVYDYQWYLFTGVSKDSQIVTIEDVDNIKKYLKKEYNIIIDKEYFLPMATIASFRARSAKLETNE